MFFADLTLTGSEFQRVGAATEKALVPNFFSTPGTKSRTELNDQQLNDQQLNELTY